MNCLGVENRIPVEGLQVAFKSSGLTAAEVARRCGYFRANDGQADQTRLLRLLGLRKYSPATRGSANPKRYIRIDIALKIAEALHIDPVELGL